MNIQPVIMSGGSGTRLWPMSRRNHPKQFLRLVTDRTMFQETVLRLTDDSGAYNEPVIVAGASHGPVIARQLEKIEVIAAEIILEPQGRNTAAVAAVAAAWAEAQDDDPLILLTPADHHIADAAGFRDAVMLGAAAASQGCIVTFGIKADRPHTGYGYIERGAELHPSVFAVKAFKEKPDAATAAEYLAAGDYFWNAGIFLFSAAAMIRELETHAPAIIDHARRALGESVMSGAARRLNDDIFSACPANSIDYAVMEKTDCAAMVAPVDVGWTDIGSWSEVASDANDCVLTINANGNVIRTSGPLIAASGVDDLIIVATGDAVLVARKDDAQSVRDIVAELKKRGRDDLL